MTSRKYSADPDQLVKWITNLIIGINLLLFAINVFFPSSTAMLSRSMLVVMIPMLIMAWGMHPLYYSVTANSIRIRRPFGWHELHFDSIQELKRIMPDELGISSRLFAFEGLFGYLGMFRSNKIGKYFMMATNQDEMILVTCQGRKMVISPRNAGSFANDYFFRSKEYYSVTG